MINGLDTTFLIEVEVQEHPGHQSARRLLIDMLDAGETLALAPQVLSEFTHIITDARRFSKPLDMTAAIARAHYWWMAKETVQIFPTDESTRLSLEWTQQYQLGRKRLLDTQLAATYFAQGVASIVTTNVRDFSIFGCFQLRRPA